MARGLALLPAVLLLACQESQPVPEGEIHGQAVCDLANGRWEAEFGEIHGVASWGVDSLSFEIPGLLFVMETVSIEPEAGRATFAMCVTGDVFSDDWDEPEDMQSLMDRAHNEYFVADDGTAPCFFLTAVLGEDGLFLPGSYWWEGTDDSYRGDRAEKASGFLLSLGRSFERAEVTLTSTTIPLLAFTDDHIISLKALSGEGLWSNPEVAGHAGCETATASP